MHQNEAIIETVAEVPVKRKPGRPPKDRNLYDRPQCPTCQKRCVAYSKSYGKSYWRKECAICSEKRYLTPEELREKGKHATRRLNERKRLKKEGPCNMCGFIPTHTCQMDWDHKDGNRFNNEEKNMNLLCSNCHRLKTWLNRDYAGRIKTKVFQFETPAVRERRERLCGILKLREEAMNIEALNAAQISC